MSVVADSPEVVGVGVSVGADAREVVGVGVGARSSDGVGVSAGRSAVEAPRPMIVAYGVLAVAASARSAEQLATRASEAPVAYGLSAVAALVYVVAWLALRRAPRGGRPARVARAACSVELAGVLLVGAASLVFRGTFAHPTVWSGFGVGYGFAPLALPVAALWWLRAARAA